MLLASVMVGALGSESRRRVVIYWAEPVEIPFASEHAKILALQSSERFCRYSAASHEGWLMLDNKKVVSLGWSFSLMAQDTLSIVFPFGNSRYLSLYKGEKKVVGDTEALAEKDLGSSSSTRTSNLL